MDHWGYLAVAIATHAAVGYAVVRTLTSCPPTVGVVAGVAPDLDLLFGPLLLGPSLSFPLVHRGLTHTPAFLGLVVLAVLLVGPRLRNATRSVSRPGAPGGTGPATGWVALGVGLSFLSHLAIDSLTRSGIMWLYPLSDHHYALDLGVHGVAGTAVLWVASVGLVRWGGRDRLR